MWAIHLYSNKGDSQRRPVFVCGVAWVAAARPPIHGTVASGGDMRVWPDTSRSRAREVDGEEGGVVVGRRRRRRVTPMKRRQRRRKICESEGWALGELSFGTPVSTKLHLLLRLVVS
jgi:hypothetical protein